MRGWAGLLFCMGFPAYAVAAESEPLSYGTGILCPRADTQVSFYTQGNQQDAAGVIAYQGNDFVVTSDTVKDMQSAGAHIMENVCAGGARGILIDARRDGWMRAGELWLPPNQEWEYGDWQEYLRKASLWKPVVAVTFYEGSMEAPYKDKPYPESDPEARYEVYPIKFVEDYALVLLDKSGAFAKGCAGTPAPPTGKLVWVHIGAEGDSGAPSFIPVHNGC